MLQSLRVKNLAIVENLAVDFQPGLNVITGETGAGKSILVGALALVLGDRAEKDMVRAGQDRFGVEAVFQLNDPAPINALLEDSGLPPCESGQLLIRRIIAVAGAAKISVNDSPATVQLLKQLGEVLVDMHGPHDHQSLLNPSFQLDVLDAFGKTDASRAAYAAIYEERRAALDQRQALQGSDQDVARQIDLLAYQVKEIEEAQLDGLDEADLDREHTVSANAQRILELTDGVRRALTEDEVSAFNALAAVHGHLAELAALLPEAATWQKEAESLSIQLQELSKAVDAAVRNIEADPTRLQWLEDRKALIHKLKRKYGGTVAEILAFLEKSRRDLADLSTRGQRLAELDTAIAEIDRRLRTAGSKLGKERRKAADALAKAITRELQALGFPHGAFSVALTESDPSPSGLDVAEFGFAPNVGEPMRPLRTIASSGEISRVMLATKAVLALHDRIPVLVFDEIDANVGGEMGLAIGSKLAAVAKHHQVLCITHLPQVAVHGKNHFVVEKQVRDGRTTTHIRTVTGNTRAEEVARMLGGKDLTSVTLKHAREMLERA